METPLNLLNGEWVKGRDGWLVRVILEEEDRMPMESPFGVAVERRNGGVSKKMCQFRHGNNDPDFLYDFLGRRTFIAELVP